MKRRLPKEVRAYFRKEGARGATMQAAEMTPAQRKARATKASQAGVLARTKNKRASRRRAERSQRPSGSRTSTSSR